MKNKSAGFTLIELVIVIVILGILAATALPRFVDLSEEAENAAVKGFAGALGSGVSLVRAVALAKGIAAEGDIDIDNDGTEETYVNADGWPIGDSEIDCDVVLSDVLQQAPADFSGKNDGDTCVYEYSRNGTEVIYNYVTGSVTVSSGS